MEADEDMVTYLRVKLHKAAGKKNGAARGEGPNTLKDKYNPNNCCREICQKKRPDKRNVSRT
jgi:hypothetical protein